MGVFYVDCTVENMASPDKSALIEQLIVDTGSEFTWIPKDSLSEVGVDVRKRNVQFVMANDEIITRDIGYAILRVNGFETVDEIVFAQWRFESLGFTLARRIWRGSRCPRK